MNKTFYTCISFVMRFIGEDDVYTHYRASSVQDLENVKNRMAVHGFKKENWLQPHSNHHNPISTLFWYKK